MFLEIVTPDEKVFEGEVESASFPGSDGSFQVLNNHAALISTLGKGDIKLVKQVDKKVEEIHMEVEGGIVEVLNNKVMVLAEKINS
ncbi:ATP synthase F1 subunit epsilon [Marinoscillum sp. MHG1-6]|uniref:ATP synthase F1 subunit epsilon n=1 Tax=Marinoscillum sp. MHG1-6 TaxID=2959627 RepID=UPI0021576DDE|nr:ATP synthase F1 subunit epsilon [Marinoscillum sp. MHG1-6]